MNELALKYGCNPNQKPSRIFMEEGELPMQVLGGRPGYINFLDALNGWQLVRELRAATGLPAAASFKHVSPAGAAVGLPMSDTLRRIYFVDDIEEPRTPIATGIENVDFSKMISLNESAAYLWKAVEEKEFDAPLLADLLQQEYEVDAATALADAEKTVESWRECGIAE